MRIPPFFRRLFKFTSMDFETAIWEMTHLIIAPKKVFRNIYYHKQTKNSYHRADPAFTYLLSLFLFLTGLAWGLAYADGFGRTFRVALAFVLVHFLGTSLVVSTAMYFLVGRVLGKRRQGLFGPPSGGGLGAGDDGLEFGYCFDVRLQLSKLADQMLTACRSPFERTCQSGPSFTFFNFYSCLSSPRIIGCQTYSEIQCISWH